MAAPPPGLRGTFRLALVLLIGISVLGLHPATVAALERPGAAPAAEPSDDDEPSVGFVSDSLAFTAREEITAEVTRDRPLSYYSALQGADISDHRDRLVELTEGPDGPHYLIVVLGTAQSANAETAGQFEADMRGLLDALTPHVTCVRWFDIQERPAPYYPAFMRNRFAVNRSIHQVADEYPEVEFVHYAHWADLAAPENFFIDDLHLSSIGDRELARLVRSAANGCDPAVATGPFWDVTAGHWAADAIAWMHDAGLATGYPNRTYRDRIATVRVPVGRGQLASMLWRNAGQPPVDQAHAFSDGAPWLDPALRWIGAQGLMDGYPDQTFRPSEPITRAAAIRLLWRTAGAPTDSPPHGFPDVPPWLDAAAVDWATATGMVVGYPDGTFGPDRLLTRGQIASMLRRFDMYAPPEPPADIETAPTADASPPTTSATSTTGIVTTTTDGEPELLP